MVGSRLIRASSCQVPAQLFFLILKDLRVLNIPMRPKRRPK